MQNMYLLIQPRVYETAESTEYQLGWVK